MNRRPFRPSAVDELEKLTLLSGLVPATAAVAPMTTAASSHFTRVHLGGTLTGTFAEYLSIDTGPAYRFTGSGPIKPLGKVTATGGLSHGNVTAFTVGTTAGGLVVIQPHTTVGNKESGQFVLTGPGGMLSISITATIPKSGSLPTLYTYKITGSTGRYAKVIDHGTARLTLHTAPAVPPAAPPGQATPDILPAPSGSFTLTFTSAKGR
jgi:hypothetical protein